MTDGSFGTDAESPNSQHDKSGFRVLHVGFFTPETRRSLPGNLDALYGYWLGKFTGDRLPNRAAIDPVEIPRHLPLLALVEAHPVPGGVRFKDRVVGTRLVELFGADTTGRWLDQQGITNPASLRTFERCWREQVPVLASSRINYPDRDFVPLTRLLLPLAGPDGAVAMVIEAFEETADSEEAT